MCGIAGIVGENAQVPIDPAVIHRMCHTIVHRGPDDEGVFVKSGAGLGMRRLSIIDLAGGHQPVFNEERTVWVVFNGEIYNFVPLREELETRGHRFSTHSDTEVIVHLYEDFGADCVSKLRGMFAFALFDERQRKLLLARDRLGKKPLHYALSNGRLLFGSEIKAILEGAPELADDINSAGLLQYFHFGYIPAPDTAFASIQKLPPAHLLEFEHGKTCIRRYWDLPQYGTYSPTTEEHCLEDLQARLTEAVRIRLMADVPLGALLSGGTDSSIVVALMARESASRVKTFTIAFEHSDFDETQYARIVAGKFGTEHHELLLEPDVVQAVESLTRSVEEPFGDSSMLPTYFVSSLARKHVTVALAGDGGDELFAGYDRYYIHRQREKFGNIPSWLRRLYREQVYPRLPPGVHGRKFAYNVSLPARERYLDMISFLPGFERDMPLLSRDFRASIQGTDNPAAFMLQHFNSAAAHDMLSQLLRVDTKTYLVEDILTKVDRMSMAVSLEVRAPLLDHPLVEWVTALTSEWKLRGQQQKYILRKLAERVGVPKEVLYRPKRGFAVPLVHWMRNEMRDLILSILTEPRTLQRGYFDPAGVRRLLNEHCSGRRDHSEGIWRLLMFELWHRNFLGRLRPQHCQEASTLASVLPQGAA
jgi:asparagine synthase (glutamine-hydrolysing)